MKETRSLLRSFLGRNEPVVKTKVPDPQPELSDPTTVIIAQGLRKAYGNTQAVKNLDLTVYTGEVIGLLGPNGSGKTTTILMLLGLTEPSAGTVRVLGYDPLRDPLSVKRRVGYMPDSVGFYDHLSAFENLDYTGRLAGLDYKVRQNRIKATLRDLQISELADRKVATFSKGMRQRLGLAEVLVKEPSLIILDEPTSGLDPEGAREFLDIIRNLKQKGITILLSSHLLHQVQAVCDRVCLFYKGNKVLEGSVDDITTNVIGGTHLLSITKEGTHADTEIAKIQGVLRVNRSGPHSITVEADRDVRSEVAKVIVASGDRLLGLSDTRPTLDDVYTRYFEKLHTSGDNNTKRKELYTEEVTLL